MVSLAAGIKTALMESGIRIETLRDLRHELHLVHLRVKRHYSPNQRRKERALSQLTGVNLHFGCGRRILPDWVNLDAYATEGISLEVDLQRPLPLADGSVRWIFTEHVLEHIDRRRIRSVFSEFHRILEPGGVARILVPDLVFYCRAYMADDEEAITTVLPNTKTSAEGVNSVFNDHFHRFIYDFETMKLELERAGFSEIVHCSYGQSHHDGLACKSCELSRRGEALSADEPHQGLQAQLPKPRQHNDRYGARQVPQNDG